MNDSESLWFDIGSNYEWVQYLAEGGFAKTCLVQDKRTGEYVAVKYLNRGPNLSRNVEREILNHIKLSGHLNVVAFKEVFLTATHLGIAMEYANGGDMIDVVNKGLSEDQARYFFQQLVCGLNWCHLKNVSHRDIKPDNMVLHHYAQPYGSVLRLVDFGYAKDEAGSQAKTKVGTMDYMAPEVFERPEADERYQGMAADIWSCGVALYTMLVKASPFRLPTEGSRTDNAFQRVIEQRIRQAQYSIPPDVKLSADATGLLQRMLVPNPVQRITLAEIQQHPWFTTNLPDWCRDGGFMLHYSPPAQSEEEIRKIVAEARRPVVYGQDPVECMAGDVWTPDDDDELVADG